MGEVEKDLQEAAVKYEALEEEKKKQDQQVSELTRAGRRPGQKCAGMSKSSG
jgi:hypothetical protein